MKNADPPIVKPRPLPGWNNKKVFYIPVDTLSRTIFKSIEHGIKKEKITPLGTLLEFNGSTILYHCIGAPLAVLSLERLIVSGAEEIILLGFCGTLNPDFQIGHAALITQAYSEEGTSPHYIHNKRVFKSEETSQKNTESFLNQRGLPFHKGSIVSTDAPYRETFTWLEKKRNKGIDFVDMETSAVFALAEYYNISASALMLVSDKLTHKTHRFKFHSSKLEKAVAEYFLPLIQ
jgi:purine-nucleoside phosphorylase